MSAFGIKRDANEINKQFLDNYKDDGSGFSLEEFKSVMSKNLEDRYSRNEIKKIFDLFDENKSQKINFQNLRTIADEIGSFIFFKW